MCIGIDALDIFSPPEIISKGIISKENGENVPFIIELGLSKSSILECNKWKDFVTEIIMPFVINGTDKRDYKELLQSDIMLEDSHWNWIYKAFKYNNADNNWFFLKTSDGIQGVCITYHPKESFLQNVDIFYIEYLSCAPWNRNSTLHTRKYKGIGTEILKQVQYFFIAKYHYSYGFSLLSLPQAQGFYEKIGMVNISEYNEKNGLFFYEMSKENAILFFEGRNAAISS